jgi:hypothetical protein
MVFYDSGRRSTLKSEEVSRTEKWVTIYESTRCRHPENFLILKCVKISDLIILISQNSVNLQVRPLEVFTAMSSECGQGDVSLCILRNI